MRYLIFLATGILTSLLLLACSAEAPDVKTDRPAPSQTPEVNTPFDVIPAAQPEDVQGTVVLYESIVDWETLAFELTDFNTIKSGSFDSEVKTEVQFSTWVLENEYLQVTLLPEFGGRILSIIYKPTGHETLYQNPLGVPYQIDTNIFYYNWLMVYGGIFPTFPEPEHGKTWFLPWDFEIIEETEQRVTVSMAFIDDIEHPFAPRQYDTGVTGMQVTYYVTLETGRAALDTRIVLENTTDETVAFEYWTNTTLAPGSDPADPRTTVDAEIIAPVDMIKIPGYWKAIASQEKPTGLIEVHEFEKLHRFENWPDMGIAYAFPDISKSNFWGVINHANREGIFRIADNTLTPGMKIWTWGYPQTRDLDLQAGPNEARPYIELWAGLTREFWQRTTFSPHQVLEIEETYSPSVGMSNVTHANTRFLVNLSRDEENHLQVEIFGMLPGQPVEASLFLGDEMFFELEIMLDPLNGNAFSVELPANPENVPVHMVLRDLEGSELFQGTAPAVQHED